MPDTERDVLHKLKAIAYYRVCGVPKGSTLSQYIDTAKFLLCEKTNTLWKDPIWDSYTDEELLIEYFSYLHHYDEDFKTSFENIEGLSERYIQSAADYFDEQIALNEKELEKNMERETEEVISLDMDELGV